MKFGLMASIHYQCLAVPEERDRFKDDREYYRKITRTNSDIVRNLQSRDVCILTYAITCDSVMLRSDVNSGRFSVEEQRGFLSDN